MEVIVKIVKSLEESGVLMKEISETIEDEAKEHKEGFLRILLGTLAASLLGSALTGKRMIIAGEGVIRVGQKF